MSNCIFLLLTREIELFHLWTISSIDGNIFDARHDNIFLNDINNLFMNVWSDFTVKIFLSLLTYFVFRDCTVADAYLLEFLVYLNVCWYELKNKTNLMSLYMNDDVKKKKSVWNFGPVNHNSFLELVTFSAIS